MNEQLLQFIWHYSLYNPSGLQSSLNEPITVIYSGKLNTNAGPDFEEGKVKIGETILVGNIELHLRTSDWYKHGHQHNPNYSNIILHVVYENDLPINNDSHIPMLELSKHIPKHIIDNYFNLQHNIRQIPCAAQLPQVKDIIKKAWLNRLIAERWEMKFEEWDELLKQSAGDWRVLLYWRLAANFGFKINTDAFLTLAQSLPVNILSRHHENLFQLEALLLGQAGMLTNNFEEEYPFKLKKEYEYLRKKYKLEPISVHLWKFMRLRPANFPTLRIAQFAALIHRSFHLFSQIVSSSSLNELTELFEVCASDYWDNHVLLDEEQKSASSKHLGQESIYNIIINTIAPIRFMYSSRSGLGDHCETSIQLLEQMNPEKNSILNNWTTLGWRAENAAESQGLIQLYNNYCSNKQCLSCSVGHSIIKRQEV
jgi:hypothetical protein